MSKKCKTTDLSISFMVEPEVIHPDDNDQVAAKTTYLIFDYLYHLKGTAGPPFINQVGSCFTNYNKAELGRFKYVCTDEYIDKDWKSICKNIIKLAGEKRLTDVGQKLKSCDVTVYNIKIIKMSKAELDLFADDTDYENILLNSNYYPFGEIHPGLYHIIYTQGEDRYRSSWHDFIDI